MTRVLITTAAALTAMNKSIARRYAKLADDLAIAAVSNIVHAAEHGDPSTLNTFYSILGTNDQTALRAYVGRLTAIVGGWDGVTKVPAEDMKDYKQNGAFIEFSKGEFKIITVEDHEAALVNRETVVGLANEMLNPDGKKFMDFNARNILGEIKTLGDDGVISKIDKIIKEAAGDTKVETKVSPAMLAKLKDFRNTLGATTVALGNA